jgi:CRP/FNR family transcriptional regulator, nitrogen fixation regulation protein
MRRTRCLSAWRTRLAQGHPLGALSGFSSARAELTVWVSNAHLGTAMLIRTATTSVAARMPGRPFSGAQSVESISEAMELMGARISYVRDVEIFGEGEPAEYLYKVVTGTVRICKVLDDGRRQVTAFHMPGEIFGLEVGDTHSFCAEAIADSTIIVVKRHAILALAARDVDIASQLWTLTARELQRGRDHMLILGCIGAKEKVAAFLLELAKRCSDTNEIKLPMSRQDIADYLGLTIETVSRTMTQLENDATIMLPTSRRVVLRNRAALKRLNS